MEKSHVDPNERPFHATDPAVLDWIFGLEKQVRVHVHVSKDSDRIQGMPRVTLTRFAKFKCRKSGVRTPESSDRVTELNRVQTQELGLKV